MDVVQYSLKCRGREPGSKWESVVNIEENEVKGSIDYFILIYVLLASL